MCDRLSYAFSDPAAILFLDGLAEVIEPAGAGLLLLPGAQGMGPPAELVQRAVVDGLVTYCLPDDDPALEIARERGVPLVLVDHAGRSGEATVRIDDPGGGTAIVQHLIDLGHTRLAVVSYELGPGHRHGPVDADRLAGITFGGTRERLGGYRTALAGAGLDWPATPIFECDHNARQPGREAAATLLADRPRPTAIVAMSDELALGVLQAASDAGLDVPRDLSVVGFDDTPAAARAIPPLTTVPAAAPRKGRTGGPTAARTAERHATRPGPSAPDEHRRARVDIQATTLGPLRRRRRVRTFAVRASSVPVRRARPARRGGPRSP